MLKIATILAAVLFANQIPHPDIEVALSACLLFVLSLVALLIQLAPSTPPLPTSKVKFPHNKGA